MVSFIVGCPFKPSVSSVSTSGSGYLPVLCSPRGAKIGWSSYIGFLMDFTKLTPTDQHVMVHLNSGVAVFV